MTKDGHDNTTAALLRRYYTEVWECGNLDLIPEFFKSAPPEQVLLPQRCVDVAEVREWMEILHSLVTNITVTFVHTVESEDWAAVLLHLKCDSRTDGSAMSVHQHIMARQRDGLLVQSYPHFDLLRFFEQLGQLPEDTHALLMGGVRLR